MTSQATLYEDAQIDAAAITAFNGSANAPFWRQAHGSAIRRIRSMSMLAGNGEPSLREAAALLDNDTVLEALVQAGAARIGETEREHENRINQGWLKNDWRAMDHGLRNRIVEGIRLTAASRLTLIGPTNKKGTPTVGERRGPWLHDGQLRWNVSRLPAHIRKAVHKVVHQLHGTAWAGKQTTPAETGPPEEALAAENEGNDDLRRNIINVIANAAVAASCLCAITVEESQQLKNQIAEWRARLRRPRGKGRTRGRTPRRTTADTNPDRTAPTAPAATE